MYAGILSETFDASGSGYAVCGADRLAGGGVHHCMAQKNSRREAGRLWFLRTFQAAQFAAVPHAGGLAAPREAAAQRHVSDDDADGSPRRPSRPRTTHIPTRRWFPPGVYHTRIKSTEFPEASCRRVRPTPGFYLGG